MSNRALGFIFAAVVLVGSAVQAEIKPRLLVEFDHFYGDGFKDTQDEWDQWVSLETIGLVGEVNAHSQFSKGRGYRAGVMVPAFWKGFEIGGTAGLIEGPGGKIWVRKNDQIAGFTVMVDDHYETEFSRYLIEARQRFPLYGSFGATVGLGVGLAHGRLDNHTSVLVTNAPPIESVLRSHSDSFSGLSYEIGAGITFSNPAVNAGIGIFYAVFPETDNVSPFLDTGPPGQGPSDFKWNPIGIKLTLEFL